MDRTDRFTAALAMMLLIGAACGTARRTEPIAGPHRLDDASLVAGQRAFAAYCQECHPFGETGLAPAINNKPLPGWLIRFQVRHGLGDMPAFSEDVIDDEELDQIVEYLKYLRRRDPVRAP